VRFQFYCITFASSSHQYWARPCLPPLILYPSIYNNNLIRLNLIKLLNPFSAEGWWTIDANEMHAVKSLFCLLQLYLWSYVMPRMLLFWGKIFLVKFSDLAGHVTSWRPSWIIFLNIFWGKLYMTKLCLNYSARTTKELEKHKICQKIIQTLPPIWNEICYTCLPLYIMPRGLLF
jgi:hypothetical protein